MFSSVFNVSNLFALILFLVFIYVFWEPFIRGKAIEATVDGYVHTKEMDEKDKNLYYCIRFMYRLQKSGKRYFCYSKRKFDTQKEAMEAFPKGTPVRIKYLPPDSSGRSEAVILSDSKDRNKALLYTLYAFLGISAVVFGYSIFGAKIGLK